MMSIVKLWHHSSDLMMPDAISRAVVSGQGAIAYQFTVKVSEWLTPFEVPVIVKV